MKYLQTELHSHTMNSDGDFTTAELVQAAKDFGYKILAITDHNTMAPTLELQQLTKETEGIRVLKGMEWTTFYGHLLVIGAREVIDWRDAEKDTIDASLKAIKAVGGITGIAHPFSIGSPICTGCSWDFHVEDFGLINFIEVWNRLNPDDNFRSQQAYDMWVDLLDQGYRVSCSAGRDWHRQEAAGDNTALTVIGVSNIDDLGLPTEEETLESLKRGNFYISLGPILDLYVSQKGQRFYMGDELSAGTTKATVKVSGTEQEKLKHFGFFPEKIVVISNGKVISEREIDQGSTSYISLTIEPGYLRFEVWGTAKHKVNERLIITNPYYVV
ncbi:MAG: CehA/McbA family metallohydrolase [Bavariicoccus seileri]|uniref:CehA/McbA family metallohydrolase n=1 Tax=Bavariicoccus seileri TaxID=549685 RepID=UPI003F95597D